MRLLLAALTLVIALCLLGRCCLRSLAAVCTAPLWLWRQSQLQLDAVFWESLLSALLPDGAAWRTRSLLFMPLLPWVDIAWRRARTIARLLLILPLGRLAVLCVYLWRLTASTGFVSLFCFAGAGLFLVRSVLPIAALPPVDIA